jgi:hypothetical protein
MNDREQLEARITELLATMEQAFQEGGAKAVLRYSDALTALVAAERELAELDAPEGK